MQTTFRVVPDTNVIIAAQNNNPLSPNREFIERWKNREFQVCYSEDTLEEYLKKLSQFGFSDSILLKLTTLFLKLGEEISIDYYHLEKYPDDPDDTAFLLCAHNGGATHLVSYDRHLLNINEYFDFLICEPVPFLKKLRQELSTP